MRTLTSAPLLQDERDSIIDQMVDAMINGDDSVSEYFAAVLREDSEESAKEAERGAEIEYVPPTVH